MGGGPRTTDSDGGEFPQSSRGTPRKPQACFTCRRKKVKCSGQHPCQFCTDRHLECRFGRSEKRKLFSVSQLQEMEARLARYERQELQQVSPQPRGEPLSTTSPAAVNPATASFVMPSPSQGQQREGHGASPSISQHSLSPGGDLHNRPSSLNSMMTPSVKSVIEADRTMSSSHTFGSEVYRLVNDKRPTAMGGERTTYDGYPHLQDTNHHTNLVQPTQAQFPSEKEAISLLQSTILYIGDSQSLFEPRDVYDNIHLFYTDIARFKKSREFWVSEVLLIIAIGLQLVENKSLEKSTSPGLSQFEAAMAVLPEPSKWRVNGIAVVRIMGLATIVMQNLDRRDDAHFYTSLGLKIALSCKMHLADTEDRAPSESTRRNRLWWSIYMQDRRLAAATGNPVGIADDAITTELPSAALGFSEPVALNVNISIAKVTGRILTSIYSLEALGQESFIPTIRGILSTLQEIAQSLPAQYKLDPTEGGLKVSRTSASLNLMFYQALMLATRPVLLHLAKNVNEETSEDTSGAMSPPYGLSRTCIEAARRSISILKALHRQGLLSTFGFFDLDALFSAAFIIVISATLDNTSASQDSVHIQDACTLLEHMTWHGNQTASNRRMELLRMCDSLALEIDRRPTLDGRLQRAEVVSPHDGRRHEPAQNTVRMAQLNDLVHGNVGPSSSAQDPRPPTLPPSQLHDWDPLTLPDPNTVFNHFDPTHIASDGPGGVVGQHHVLPSFDASVFAEEGQEQMLYEIFHDSDLELTGVDTVDWDEMERHLARNHS